MRGRLIYETPLALLPGRGDFRPRATVAIPRAATDHEEPEPAQCAEFRDGQGFGHTKRTTANDATGGDGDSAETDGNRGEN